ncbi:excinuclease ABC subunit UvrC [Methanococcoides sp. NM1]|uniref:excinuclease ABC subunit UvrC n=1 Tax=Methanococcoides sp. NM1 TaxID=1201013 RepID=UPI0010835495|nr:excinuclease ABC subunit UvrC [Methanococcoides sp. NM1]
MKPDISNIPNLPGVYLMKDGSDNIIYIGKAKSLKKRVSQYFQSGKNHSSKTRAMVRKIEDIDYIVTDSEVEALILEANLVKKNRPHYNIDLKDDKRYPYVKVTVNKKFPRIFITRKRLMDGALYFGPYTNVKPVRRTLDMISQVFRIKRCNRKIDGKKSRPCLNYHIGRCYAPCNGSISEEEYRRNVMEAVKFFKGDTSSILNSLQQKMQEHAKAQEFETAAAVRDQIAALKSLSEQQTATAGNNDSDLIATAADEDNIFVQIFYIRDGNMVGKADFSLSWGDAAGDISKIVAEFIKQYYQDAPVPPEILVQYPIPEKELITKWLSEKASRSVHVQVPARGDKKKLLDMAARNAIMTMEQSHIKRSDRENALQALVQLRDELSLPTLPAHIEGFDISNISGTDAVGSLVVFNNGMPAKDKYRHFNIKTVKGIDDFAMMAEVVKRRYKKQKNEDNKLPDLILIDGGPGQVGAAMGSLRELGLDIPLVGLAKRFEHIIVPKEGQDEVVILPHTSDALRMLMQVRDESHRFAVSSHRRRRTARLSHSELDSIPGIGSFRKKALLNHFGSIEKIRRASVEELAEVEGISKGLAEKIVDHFVSKRD